MFKKNESLIFKILFFAIFGIATEVVFTAFLSFFENQALCNKPLYALAGMTYVWMFPIYGLIPILGSFIFPIVQKFILPIRLLMYTILIYIIEFCTGYLLELCLGYCPWKYTSGIHLMGLIRLDYFPAWMFFCFLLEKIYTYLDGLFVLKNEK